ncbi:MAG TPA: LysM peptidoglycan-binding domain-containing protein [Anaerolineales bacterium]|nr:LysM peptidoglycan-binding domain-containing protein [Anaerolineales bacterium]
MNKIIRTSLSLISLLVLAACNLFTPRTPSAVDIQALRLTVQTQSGSTTFSQVGEIINYNYIVNYTGTTALAGPVTITDAPRTVTCPALTTVGDADNFLETNESITCTAPYSVTESDFNTGSITNVATVAVGGAVSSPTGITLTRAVTPTPSPGLTLAKNASVNSYGQVGQTITYTFVVTNTGTVPLGPTQFTITDNRLGAPFNCGPANTTLAASQSLNCSAPYIITQADLNSPNLTNSATVSGAGLTSAPVTFTLTNQLLTQTATTQQPPSNLTPGTTVQHQVRVGEWLIQIARCYGATLSEVRTANPTIPDLNMILPSMTVTIPRIGSAGTIYGPNDCVTFQTVQSGDTWTSIAQRYNACVAVLQRVNPALTVGTNIKIPRNSAGLYCPGSSTSPSTAVPGVTNTPQTTAQRITIDPGQTTATRIGIINPNERIQFVLNAAAGQTLTIRLTAPANEVAVGVTGPTGLILKPLDPTPTWSSVIANGGDHFITVAAVLGSSSKSYTLEVSLNTVVPTATFTNTVLAPTATATATTGPGQ